MLNKFLNRFIRRNHYWRDLEFDELSELYTSMMFRSLAMCLVGIFIPIYLYQMGYPVWEIFFFYCMVFAVHTAVLYPVALLIAKVGPKHTILVSYVFQVIAMLLLLSLDTERWPLLAVAAALGTSGALFFTAFHVDFSKVKHTDHGGKEVGWMYSMERIGAVLGPLIGGLVAYFVGAEYIFLVAIGLLFIGIVPLFITSEPTAVNQKLHFHDLHVRDIKRDLLSMGFFQVESVNSLIVWPLFISIYVFTENPYIQLGSITSLSILVSLFIARAIGRTIDKKKGRSLLRYGASLNAGLHLFRPFTSGYIGALGVNLLNEVFTPAYRMPLVKGFYDAADDLPGKRIVYISAVEAVSSFTRTLFFMAAGVAAYLFYDSRSIFVGFFIVASLASLAIMLEKYKALDPK